MANEKKKKRHWLINTLIVLLFLVGLVLVFNKPIRNWLIALNSNRYQIYNVSRNDIVKNETAKPNWDFSKVNSVNFQDILNAQLKNEPLPVVGSIAMPDVGINLPIFLGLDNTSLAYGAGTMKENQQMGKGNYALASHNVTGYDSDITLLFTPLEKAKDSMAIYTTDKAKVYEYKVTKVSVVQPDDVAVINDEPGKTEITLVTCADPEAKQRIIVQGEFVKEVPYDKATPAMNSAFGRRYNQLV